VDGPATQLQQQAKAIESSKLDTNQIKYIYMGIAACPAHFACPDLAFISLFDPVRTALFSCH